MSRPIDRNDVGERTAPGPLMVALAGMLSLAAAMGIGRFAFTPLLPMMLHDGLIDLAGGSWLATANYIGYFVGAVLCTVLPWYFARHTLWPALGGLFSPPAIVRMGLVATAALTLAMALDWPGLWPLLRFLSGVMSAVVFVFTSTWCLQRLVQQGAPQLGGIIYCGPGVGIMATGFSAGAMVAGDWPSPWAWMAFGGMAVLLAVFVWPVVRPQPRLPLKAVRTADSNAQQAARAMEQQGSRGEIVMLSLGYGLAGFGYIITATFLPVIARGALPGSSWPDLFWPVFGFGVVFGALVATRLPLRWDPRDMLAVQYALQALGVMFGLWFPTVAGFIVSSFLVGMPLTSITLFAMREARRLTPQLAASLMGLLTATYGIGQILGPPAATALVRVDDAGHADFSLALEVAAFSLVVGLLMFVIMRVVFPQARAQAAVR